MSKFLAASLSILLCGPLAAEDFTIRLGLKNGHLRELYLGCRKAATAGYDRKIDSFAPPPGIQTGYTVLLPEEGQNLPPFYKDIRGPAEKIQWRFYAKVFQDKEVELSWDPGSFPGEYSFRAERDGRTVDMMKTGKLNISKTQIITITATRKAAAPDEKDTRPEEAK